MSGATNDSQFAWLILGSADSDLDLAPVRVWVQKRPPFREAKSKAKVTTSATAYGIVIASCDPSGLLAVAEDVLQSHPDALKVKLVLHEGRAATDQASAVASLVNAPAGALLLTATAAHLAASSGLNASSLKAGSIVLQPQLIDLGSGEGAKYFQRRALAKGCSEVASEGVIAKRLKKLRHDLVAGLLGALLGLLIEGWLGSTKVGSQLELMAYEWLGGSTTIGTDEVSPVTVIDIRDSYEVPNAGKTDMAKLGRLVKKIGELNPAAIAIDIDFGAIISESRVRGGDMGTYPDENGGVVLPCLALVEAGKPCYVAVQDGLWNAPDTWLGRADLTRLVVHPLRLGDVPGQNALVVGPMMIGDRKVPGLADAISKSVLEIRDDHPSRREGWWLTQYEAWSKGGQVSLGPTAVPYEGGVYFLNPATLAAVERSTVRSTSPEDPLPRELVEGRAVIIGATGSEDTWISPIGNREVAGVYYHAMAAFTRIAAPVFKFTAQARVGLNIGISLLILLAVATFRLRYIADRSEARAERASTWVLTVAIMGTLIAGWMVARLWGVLWLDFLMSALLLFAHPKAEHHAVSAYRTVRGLWSKT